MTSQKKPSRKFKREAWQESVTRTFSSSTSRLAEQLLENFKETHPQLKKVIPPKPPRALMEKFEELAEKTRSMGPEELPPPIDLSEVLAALARAKSQAREDRDEAIESDYIDTKKKAA